MKWLVIAYCENLPVITNRVRHEAWVMNVRPGQEDCRRCCISDSTFSGNMYQAKFRNRPTHVHTFLSNRTLQRETRRATQRGPAVSNCVNAASGTMTGYQIDFQQYEISTDGLHSKAVEPDLMACSDRMLASSLPREVATADTGSNTLLSIQVRL